MPRYARGRRSRRDTLIAHNAADRFYAASAGVEPKFQSVVPEKRVYRKRSLADGPSEHQEQAAVISWWWLEHKRYGLPPFALFAVPNGGARDAITGARLKAEGVRRGALDLILAKPTQSSAGLFLEMKVGYNKPTDEQKEMIAYLQSVGYTATVHWNADSAIAAIRAYLT